MRRLLFFAALLAVPATVAHGDPPADAPADAAARARRIAQAKDAEAKALAEFRERVNAAIDRGVAWLRTQQRSTGAFPAFGDHLPPKTYQPMDLGCNALVLLTLAKCGVPPEDRVIERSKTWCLADYGNMKGRKAVKVYTAAVLLLALDAVYNPQAKEASAVETDRYGVKVSTKRTPCKFPPGVASLVEELAKFLAASQVTKVGGWRYPGNDIGAPAGDVDLSNTQYALLGLNAAARCGSRVSPDVFRRAAEYVLREQETDGLPADLWNENPAYEPGLSEVPRWLSSGKVKARGWTYLPGRTEPSTGSMTTAGVACLAIAKERLTESGALPVELSRRIDAGIVDGLAWLSEAFTVKDNPVMPTAAAMWHYYYLYGLERVGSLVALRHLGRHDWYREGAEHLLGAQEKSGGWASAAAAGKPADNTESEITQTCFALLFLKRSTTPPTVPVAPPVLTGGDGPPKDGRGASGDR